MPTFIPRNLKKPLSKYARCSQRWTCAIGLFDYSHYDVSPVRRLLLRCHARYLTTWDDERIPDLIGLKLQHYYPFFGRYDIGSREKIKTWLKGVFSLGQIRAVTSCTITVLAITEIGHFLTAALWFICVLKSSQAVLPLFLVVL